MPVAVPSPGVSSVSGTTTSVTCPTGSPSPSTPASSGISAEHSSTDEQDWVGSTDADAAAVVVAALEDEDEDEDDVLADDDSLWETDTPADGPTLGPNVFSPIFMSTIVVVIIITSMTTPLMTIRDILLIT
ncbi:MAG: hypothetical protein CMA72_07910 [Euryarchaeota archaeon]|jgi:hypothetical protein|nr:hypothetical protein [Euryarchaeota archaeon]